MLDLIYPEKLKCAFCNSMVNVTEAGLCRYCISLLPYLSESVCAKCGRPLEGSADDICEMCSKKDMYFNQGIVVFKFEGSIQDAIYRLKYDGEKEIAPVLGSLMADKIKQTKWHIDMIVPVPLHTERQAERGYNQSELLALEIGREAGIDVCGHILSRKKDTVSQTMLTGLQRAANVRGAFTLGDNNNLIRNKSILLVDDIVTTGATLNECSRELKQGGAALVYYIAAACPV